jgi:hypothetical protein
LKRDLVDFLKDNLDHSDFSNSEESTEEISENTTEGRCRESRNDPKENSTSSTLKHIPPKLPMGMPTALTSAEKNARSSQKDLLFQKVYLQYPPTKDQNCTEIGENDLRQTHHPIFTDSKKSSSDMDIVFVGTASCTPGITRGVSCTALRLNWKRRSIFGVPEATNAAEPSSFAGGTWVFDCGECSQVSFFLYDYIADYFWA